MTKLLALLPALGAALTPPVIAGLGLTAAGAIGEGFARRKTVRDQEALNRQWLAFQKQKIDDFQASEDANRKLAAQALGTNLAGSTEQARTSTVKAEAARLEDTFGANDLPGVQEAAFSGQQPGQSKVFDNYLARQIATATRESRDRIKALAKSSAYGGSFGGLATTDALRGNRAGLDIAAFNNYRGGDARTLRRFQSVQPEFLQFEASPLTDALKIGGSILSSGAFGGASAAPLTSPFPIPRPF